MELIVKLSKEEGITVLFASHHLHQVQQVCDRVGLFVNGKLLAEGNIQSLSQKLFSNSPYTIEVGISQTASEISDFSDKENKTGWLTEVLQPIDGIITVKREKEIFQIESSRDSASDIARAIIKSGAGITHLNRKEFGLDDIYYRYFEGGE
jgi:ABC-2 type transport system ATP-binding protein